MTHLDLLTIALSAAERLRVERNHLAVEGRLGLLDRLRPESTSSAAAEVALRRFVYDCREIADSGTTWRWCLRSLAACGFDGDAMLMLSGPRSACVDDGYGVAVASFNPNPSGYVWVPVEFLPTFHNPFKCGHAHVFETDLEARKKDAEPSRLAKWFRRHHKVDGVALEEAAGAEFQKQILLERGLPPCRKHLPVDWTLVLTAAANIHGSVRPWGQGGVRQAIDNYSFPSSETPDIRCPGEERLVLRSLFFDPITWDGADTRVSNGQHRICGMRIAGVQSALISQI